MLNLDEMEKNEYLLLQLDDFGIDDLILSCQLLDSGKLSRPLLDKLLTSLDNLDIDWENLIFLEEKQILYELSKLLFKCHYEQVNLSVHQIGLLNGLLLASTKRNQRRIILLLKLIFDVLSVDDQFKF